MFKRPIVAIDVGSSAIKVVELSGSKQKKLTSVGLELLPPGAVVDGVIQNQPVVEQALKSLLKKLKISVRGRRAALSLGGSSVLIKRINFTRSKDVELSEQVYYEAEQHFQADMAEIYFDYADLGSNVNANTGESTVLLAGAKREMVEQYISLIRAVGMRTGVVECDVFSTANMFEYNYGAVSALYALINIGASVTQITLFEGGEYLYTRDVAIGGEECSRQIMEMLGVDRDNAESLKLAASQGDANTPPELARLIGELNDQLVAETQMTMDYFFQSGDAGARSNLAGVFLMGGGSRLLGLDAALAASLQVPVRLANPFQRVEVNQKRFQMDYLLMQGSLYAVAVGLGMRAVGDSK